VSPCDLALTFECKGKDEAFEALAMDNNQRLPTHESNWYSGEVALLGEHNGRITKSFLSGV
jgi:hypothetical protein